jgi:hypothetical protein
MMYNIDEEDAAFDVVRAALTSFTRLLPNGPRGHLRGGRVCRRARWPTRLCVLCSCFPRDATSRRTRFETTRRRHRRRPGFRWRRSRRANISGRERCGGVGRDTRPGRNRRRRARRRWRDWWGPKGGNRRLWRRRRRDGGPGPWCARGGRGSRRRARRRGLRDRRGGRTRRTLRFARRWTRRRDRETRRAGADSTRTGDGGPEGSRGVARGFGPAEPQDTRPRSMGRSVTRALTTCRRASRAVWGGGQRPGGEDDEHDVIMAESRNDHRGCRQAIRRRDFCVGSAQAAPPTTDCDRVPIGSHPTARASRR